MTSNHSNHRKALESYRNRLNLSQEQLAAQCGLTRNAVQRYESGSAEPKARAFFRLCKALQVPPLELAKAFEFDIDGIPDSSQQGDR